MATLTLFPEASGARFSKDGLHRYALWRIWQPDLPSVMFIGLNPSRADGVKDDPTIRKVKKFASHWGYGSVYMLNLFSWISPYPEDLLTQQRASNTFTDMYLEYYATRCEKIIFAWGAFDTKGREKKIISMFPDAYCLKKNKDGSPVHPLYQDPNLTPTKFRNQITAA